MQLKNMATKHKDTGLVSEEGKKPKYGYGLRIHLDEQQLKALGITTPLPVGTLVTIQAKGMVESTRESVEADAGEDDRLDISMSVQITDLGMEEAGEAPNPADVLYTSS